MKKCIYILLILVLLLTGCAPAIEPNVETPAPTQLTTEPTQPTQPTTAPIQSTSEPTNGNTELPEMNAANVYQAVADYLAVREAYLLGRVTQMNWANMGIVRDEATHLARYKDQGIVLNSTSYNIQSMVYSDYIATVTAAETVTYTQNGNTGTETVIHRLTIYLEDDLIVAADGYTERFSGFDSCSYVPPTPATDSELARYSTLFGDHKTWYNKALVGQYETPTQLKLLDLFYNGFEGERTPTDAERAQLKDNPGFNENFDFFRLPVDKMDAVLTEYFGITTKDLPADSFEGLMYIESTGCYYHSHTDAWVTENFQIISVQTLADGAVEMRYTKGYTAAAYVAMLQPFGEGYRIISNVAEK